MVQSLSLLSQVKLQNNGLILRMNLNFVNTTSSSSTVTYAIAPPLWKKQWHFLDDIWHR